MLCRLQLSQSATVRFASCNGKTRPTGMLHRPAAPKSSCNSTKKRPRCSISSIKRRGQVGIRKGCTHKISKLRAKRSSFAGSPSAIHKAKRKILAELPAALHAVDKKWPRYTRHRGQSWHKEGLQSNPSIYCANMAGGAQKSDWLQ